MLSACVLNPLSGSDDDGISAIKMASHAKCMDEIETNPTWIMGSKLINILQASLLAMRRAVEQLTIQPEHVLVDGNKIPQGLSMSCEAIVGGDALHAEISAASILAKVTRDHQMIEMDRKYPQFGFAKHKGYPTKAHFEAIAEHGVIDEHRRSFGPVKKMIEVLEQK